MPIVPDDPFAELDVAGAPRSLVALGGTLDADTLVAAYRAGLFPWPSDDPGLERQARRLARTRRVPLLPCPIDAVQARFSVSGQGQSTARPWR